MQKLITERQQKEAEESSKKLELKIIEGTRILPKNTIKKEDEAKMDFPISACAIELVGQNESAYLNCNSCSDNHTLNDLSMLRTDSNCTI